MDGLRLDADGYLVMDAYGAGPELSDDEVLDLRDALLADPVEEPTADEWSDLVDGAVEVDAVDAGPFAIDDLPLTDDGADPSVDLVDADGAEADLDADPDADADAPDPDDDLADVDASVAVDDWALDGGDVDLDLVELDGGDDLFPADAGDDALPEVVPDIEDLL